MSRFCGYLWLVLSWRNAGSDEHTGLLKREDREELERRFKAQAQQRQPWDPNLLSCTPTLETGIDIGGEKLAVLREDEIGYQPLFETAGWRVFLLAEVMTNPEQFCSMLNKVIGAE